MQINTVEGLLILDKANVHIDQTLRELIRKALDHYFVQVDKNMPPKNMYQMVIEAIEIPLLEATMAYTRNNQCQAAEILGISRNTLRKKLQQHNLLV